jgi:hypothetical protein
MSNPFKIHPVKATPAFYETTSSGKKKAVTNGFVVAVKQEGYAEAEYGFDTEANARDFMETARKMKGTESAELIRVGKVKKNTPLEAPLTRKAPLWDLTTTDLPYYDDPIGYAHLPKDSVAFELVDMTPMQYMKLTKNELITADMEQANEYAAAMRTGKKSQFGNVSFPVPFLEIDADTHQVVGHEGFHRAKAAYLIGEKTIPVRIYLNRKGKLSAFEENDYLLGKTTSLRPQGTSSYP